MATFFEHALEVTNDRVAAERAELRARSFAEGWAEGWAEGRAEGWAEVMTSYRGMLNRLAEKHLYAKTAERLAELVGSIDDPEHLAEMAEIIAECDTAEELLSRLG